MRSFHWGQTPANRLRTHCPHASFSNSLYSDPRQSHPCCNFVHFNGIPVRIPRKSHQFMAITWLLLAILSCICRRGAEHGGVQLRTLSPVSFESIESRRFKTTHVAANVAKALVLYSLRAPLPTLPRNIHTFPVKVHILHQELHPEHMFQRRTHTVQHPPPSILSENISRYKFRTEGLNTDFRPNLDLIIQTLRTLTNTCLFTLAPFTVKV